MKLFKKAAKVLIAGVLSVSMIATPVIADEQESLEAENDSLMAQVAADEQKLNELKENITDIENYIRELDAAVEEIENRIADYEVQKSEKQERIEELKQNIEELEKEINVKEIEIDQQYANMKMRIKFLYENVDDSYLESIFASTSFSEAVEKIQYLLELTSYDRRMMIRIQDLVKGVEADKKDVSDQVSEIELQVADIENLSEAQAANQVLLEEAKVMKSAELEETKQEVKEYEEAISTLNARIAANQGQIDAIVSAYLAELAAEQEAATALSEEEIASIEAESLAAESRAAEESASIEAESIAAESRAAEESASIEAARQAALEEEESRSIEAEENSEEYEPTEFVEPETTTFILPETTTYTLPEIPSGGITSGSSDSFIWPLNGYYTITSYFGDRSWDPDIPAGAEWHYGLDIYAPSGTPILAVADGVVTYVDWLDSIGNIICVYHAGTGVTTEMHHMSGAAVGVGTRVSQGDTIGYVGATGYLCTGAHLHFAVFPGSNPLSSNYVDPLPYLP